MPTNEHENCPIELINIKGTNHTSYQCQNWIRMLAGLNRCFSSYNFESFYEFFREKEYNNSGFSFDKFGDIFIITGGNNRICIAKFIGLEKLYGNVTEHYFDNELFELISKLHEHNFDIEFRIVKRNEIFRISLLDKVIEIEEFQLKKEFLSIYQDITSNFIYN